MRVRTQGNGTETNSQGRPRLCLKVPSDPPAYPDKQSYLDAITALRDITEVALVAVPGLSDDLRNDVSSQQEILLALIEQAEELHDRLVVLDVRTDPAYGEDDHAIQELETILKWIDGLRNDVNKAARATALYHPRLTILDPLGGLRDPLRNVPPSGHVAGLISRLDRQRGAHHTPANAEII